MATPYFQYTFDSVPSTQDVARDKLEDLPVLAIAARQTEGRGRTGNTWLNAEQAFAASLAYRHPVRDGRPISLMAGVAARRALGSVDLKWPNDVQRGGLKIGGILVERSGGVTVVGFGLNVSWEDPPEGVGALFDEPVGESRHVELAALWGAELARLLEGTGWPIGDYRDSCVTLGRQITWEPDGAGKAVDVTDDGGLIVETDDGPQVITSGEVHSVRS